VRFRYLVIVLVEIKDFEPVVIIWREIGAPKLLCEAWVGSVEGRKLKPRGGFDDGVCLAVEEDGAAVAITCPKLLARHCDDAVLAVSYEDRFAGGPDEDFAALEDVDLDLITARGAGGSGMQSDNGAGRKEGTLACDP